MGLVPGVVEIGQRGKGKDMTHAPVGWRGGALTWRHGSGWRLCFRRGERGVRGSSPPGRPRGTHTGAPRSACVPAGGPAVPSRASGQARGAVLRSGGEKLEKREEVGLTSRPHSSVTDRKKKRLRRLVGCVGAAAGWAGWASRRLGRKKGLSRS
jgi:hypothetical protein